MKREIKFRAWDRKEKLWIAGWSIGQSGVMSETGDKVFMQYTGLKDKNGKEIYEGDIVQVEGAIPAEIYWEYCSWQLRNGNQAGGMLGNWESEQIEVMGNIHENPELLN